MRFHPHIKPRFNRIQAVMFDVIIALLPCLFVAWLAYGFLFLKLLGIAILTAFVTEFLFSSILLKKYNTIFDGSALVTAILLVCTLAPLTPWYVVSFGAFSAILFGKIVWGGLGKNRFNPALFGRELMSVFFASIMTSPNLWKSSGLIEQKSHSFFIGLETFASDYFSGIIYKTNGALGEYSILAMVLGGLYLLLRNRISWHIPFSLLAVFTVLMWLNGSGDLNYSIAGILFGTLFMATDMPSSPTTPNGKLFYGGMTAVCLFIFIKGGIRFEYTSYAILLMNGFADKISLTFKPRAWGETLDYKKKVEEIFILTLKIVTVSSAVLTLYWNDLISYVIYTYIVYIIFKFRFSFSKSVNQYV